MAKSFTLLLLLVFCAGIHAEKYMALSKKGATTYIALPDIDSITFIDTANLIQGTILYSKPFFHRVDEFNTLLKTGGSGVDNAFGASGLDHAGAPVYFANIFCDLGAINSVLLPELHNGAGQNLGIKIGDTLYVQATIPNGMGNDETESASFIIVDDYTMAGMIAGNLLQYRVATLAQLLLAMQCFLTGTSWRGGAGSNAFAAIIKIMPDGKVCIDNSGSAQAIKNLAISSSRSISSPYVASAFAFNATIFIVGASAVSETPGKLLRPALATDRLFDYMFWDAGNTIIPGAHSMPQIFTNSGDTIDIVYGDTIIVSANVGVTSKSASSFIVDAGAFAVHSATSFQNLLDYIQTTLALPVYDNSPANHLSLSIANPSSDALLPSGAIVVRGQPSPDFTISNFSLQAKHSDGSPAPSGFNQNCVMIEF